MPRRLALALAAVLAIGGPAWGGEAPPSGADPPAPPDKRCWIEPWYCKDPPDRPPVVDPPPPAKRCWIEPWYCNRKPGHPPEFDPSGGSNAPASPKP